MNEELKIIIKAVTDEAKKQLADVKKELNGIEKSGKQAGTGVAADFAKIKKGALAASAAITAFVAAMTKLGNSAKEVEKGFSKLNTAFASVGASAEQATKTYKELFGFLGEHDKAIETAQSLALITTNEEELAEWTNILQGAFALMGDKLPTEGLAEAANETINVGKVSGVLADALNWLGVNEDAFNASLAQTTTLEEREVLVRSTLNNLYGGAASIYAKTNKATIDYNKSQANLNLALSAAAAYTTPFLTAINNLGVSFLTNFGPALRTAAVYLTGFIQLIAEAIAWVGSFFGVLSPGAEGAAANVRGYQQAMAAYTNALQNSFRGSTNGIKDTEEELAKLKRQTAGFDELNILGGSNTSSTTGDDNDGGSSGIKLPVMPNPADYGIGGGEFFNLDDFQADVDLAKDKLKGLLIIIGDILVGIAGFRLIKFIDDIRDAQEAIDIMNTKSIKIDGVWKKFTPTDEQIARGKKGEEYLKNLKTHIKEIAGKAMTIGGTAVFIYQFADAWGDMEAINWGELAVLIGAAALAVGGLAMSFGQLGAAIGGAVAGLALLVIGVQDFVENGISATNTILILLGSIAAGIAVAVIAANPVAGIVAGLVLAVGGFTAAIILEKSAIMDVETAQEALTEAKKAAEEAEWSYINAVDAAEAALKRLEEAEKAAEMTGEELYALVEEGTLDYKDMNDAQRELYKAYLDNEKKQRQLAESTEALTEAKKAETVASYEHDLALAKESGSYDDFRDSVIKAYKDGSLSAEDAQMLISKAMSEMDKDTRKTFTQNIPNDIKSGLNPSKYETVARKLKNWFSDLWDSITSGLSNAWDWLTGKSKKEVKVNATIGSDVPKMASGGIVHSATLATIGEAGKEAVLPLENNTEWMDILANRINGHAPSKIILQLDGKALGEATIDSINGITRQSGKLQLAIV